MLARLVLVLAIAAGPFVATCQAARSVVIVSIDGLRPDVALRGEMPALRSLMARGSFTMFATTTDTAVTLPSHVSMLTGVSPGRHRIVYNHDPGPGDRAHPAWPTLFELAHRAGLSTAMSAGKGKFSLFVRAGVPDLVSLPERGGTLGDSAVAGTAAGWIASGGPRVLFVHLAGVDLAGHADGWGSPSQLAAVAKADEALDRVVSALAARGTGDSTLVIVSSDHGGAGTTHGGRDPRSRFIPWVVAGPGVRGDFDLTRLPTLRVRTEDTFATACAWLGLRPSRPIEGRNVREIFEESPARP